MSHIAPIRYSFGAKWVIFKWKVITSRKNTPLALNRLFHAEWMSDEWVSIYCNIQIHLTVTAFKCELENEVAALHSNNIFDHDAVKLTLTVFCAHLTFKTWKDLQNCCRYYLFSDCTLKYRTKHIFCQTLKGVQWYFWPLLELWSSASTSYLHSADPHEFACFVLRLFCWFTVGGCNVHCVHGNEPSRRL